MKKMLLIVISIALAILDISAQDGSEKRRVVLNNGMELIGIVSSEDGMTKVVTDNGDVFYYMPNEISNITALSKKNRSKTSGYFSSPPKRVKKTSRQSKTQGYFGTIGIDAAFGSFVSRVTTIQGYFNKGFRIGLGLGVGVASFKHISYFPQNSSWGADYIVNKSNDFYESPIECIEDETYFSMPLFLHVSQELSRTEVSPYIAFNGGYDYFNGIIIDSDVDGVFIVQFIAGVDIKLNQASFRIGGGYDLWHGPMVNVNFKF